MAFSTPGETRERVFRFVRERLLEGAPPTVREVQDAMGFRAVESARKQLDALVQAKTVTIAKLMELAPPGTVDPSSTLYNSTMLVMAGLLVVALIANALVRPVDPKHHLRE